MDIASSIALTITICAIVYALTSPLFFRRLARLPPGPVPLPIIGNILQLGINPHQSLTKLSKKYGPIMSLKLGAQITIVVSSPTLAREILQKHDSVFSSRPAPDAARVHGHDTSAMVWLPVSRLWRNLRKISREQLFSTQKLDASQGLRQQELKELRDYLRGCSIKGEVVNIGEAAFTATINFISNSLFSQSFGTYGSDSTGQLKKLLRVMLDTIGEPNVSDFYPILRFIDPQGVRRRSKKVIGEALEIFDNIIKQRQEERNSLQSFPKRNDILDILLDELVKEESNFDINHLRHLLLAFILAGTDTTAATVECGMTELLRNPEKLAKTKAELKEVLGQKEIVEESDLSRLPYLQGVIKETFRLHTTTPFLLPRKADADVEINGYIVPKDAHILVNIWAYSRDQNIWPNPEMFLPERFLETKIDMGGQHFEFLPFGGGRRMCPGFNLGYRMVYLILGIMIQSFESKLENGMRREDINMDEKFALVTSKTVPLRAIPVGL